MRLIDADALIAKQANIAKTFARSDAQKSLMGRVMYNTDNAPTIDAIPVEATAKRLQRVFFSDSWEAWAEWLRRNYSDEDFAAHVDRKKDAIPVEWLQEKANGNDFVIGRAARFILHTWEQEER